MDERGTPSLSVVARVLTAPHTVESHQLQCWLKQCGESHLMPARMFFLVAQKPDGKDAPVAAAAAAAAAPAKYAGMRPVMVRDDKDGPAAASPVLVTAPPGGPSSAVASAAAAAAVGMAVAAAAVAASAAPPANDEIKRCVPCVVELFVV